MYLFPLSYKHYIYLKDSAVGVIGFKTTQTLASINSFLFKYLYTKSDQINHLLLTVCLACLTVIGKIGQHALDVHSCTNGTLLDLKIFVRMLVIVERKEFNSYEIYFVATLIKRGGNYIYSNKL